MPAPQSPTPLPTFIEEFRGEPCAEIIIRPHEVEWRGSLDAPFPASYGFIKSGLMELLVQFGPFIMIDDRPDIQVRYFRRKR